MTQDTPQLTPARKRLIRMTYHNYGTEAPSALLDMPSFAGIARGQIEAWAREMGVPDVQCLKPASPTVTQATTAPAAPDPGTTGEWYSAALIAHGLGIGVERVYGWRQFGWLCGGPLYTAADIRAFVRRHPLEIKPWYLDEASWLWLVSVLAGSRDSEASR